MPEPRQFTVSIALGNGGMTSPDDLAAALIGVASSVESLPGLAPQQGGNIRNANGVAVGSWRVI